MGESKWASKSDFIAHQRGPAARFSRFLDGKSISFSYRYSNCKNFAIGYES